MNNCSIFKSIIHYEKIDSTQKEIWRRINKNEIEDGTVILADVQTDGVGTHGKKWYTTQNNNIAFSFVLYPDVHVKKLGNITVEIAEMIVQIFKDIYHINLEIKSPNDIVVGKKKIGGILTETKLQGEMVKVLVVGIGINTNQMEFEKEIEDIASSIKKEFNIVVDNQVIINEFGYRFNEKITKRWEKN